MFLLESLELIALIGLFVQTFTAWILAALLASLRPRTQAPAAYGHFLRAFTALALALSLMALRYFRAHDVGGEVGFWRDGAFPSTAVYVLYQGLKALFGLSLLRGCLSLAERPESVWARRMHWPVVLGLAATPLLTRNVHYLLVLQAPILVACALAALRALRDSRGPNPGLRLVRVALVGLAAAWVVHAVAAGTIEFLPAMRYPLGLNSLVDLAVQIALGAGLLVGLVQEAHDRTRRAEREREELRRALDRDEHLRALGTLVSGVAHELNGPLTVILGHSELLAAASGADPSLRVVLEQAERCRGIVRNLSALAGQTLHPRRDLGVAEVLERVERGLAPEERARGQRLVVLVPPGLRVHADQAGLEQVLTNLVVNALQASPANGRVELEARADGRTVEFRVRDEGPGVPTEVRERLFEPFFTTKGPGRGTGLGLSIAHAIVRAHGGALTVEDVPGGRGALFRVRIPPADHTPPPPRARRATHANERSLLLVDDEPSVRQVLRRHAEARGWRVSEASSAEDALRGIAEADAVVCDLRMPGMGGMGLHDLLARDQPSLLARVAFMSGGLADPEMTSFQDRCRRPILTKPLDFDELFAVLAAGEGARA